MGVGWRVSAWAMRLSHRKIISLRIYDSIIRSCELGDFWHRSMHPCSFFALKLSSYLAAPIFFSRFSSPYFMDVCFSQETLTAISSLKRSLVCFSLATIGKTHVAVESAVIVSVMLMLAVEHLRVVPHRTTFFEVELQNDLHAHHHLSGQRFTYYTGNHVALLLRL